MAGRRLCVLFGACVALLPGAVRAGERPHRFIYNSDGGNIFIDKKPPMRPADVHKFVDEVVGSQVTTYFICPNYGMPMMYPSKASEMLGTYLDPKRSEKLEDIAAEKRTVERAIVNLRWLVEHEHDPVGVVIDRAREKKLEIFITFRMNEIHDVQTADSLIVSRFWREHPQWRVGKHGDEILPLFKEIIGGRPEHKVHPIVASWFPGALNFAVPEVRARRLAQLRECCERYPIDGLDLDFQRFPIYFPQDQGAKYVETMTAWMREVRRMTREVGRKRDRSLLLSARILARPEQNLAIGLDPAAWAKKDLVDFVTVSHYLRNDFPLPIGAFRKILPAKMPIYASIEVERKPDAYRKIARRLYADGVDGILLFNFFTTRESGREPPFELLGELGSRDTIRSVPDRGKDAEK